jgi:hypothetical protein
MRRIFCDVCGKEITGKTIKKIEIPCHLWSFRGKSGYVDEDMMPVSGRYDALDACAECWNRSYSALVTAIDGIMKDNNYADDRRNS